MNIFLRELKAYRKSTAIWIVSLTVLVVVFLSMFPAFTGDVDVSRKILEKFPIAVRKALDISFQNFFSIYGFYAYLFTFVTLSGAVQAMNLGVGVISKEDSGKTADFLLTKPISRSEVITSKLFAVICLLLITNLVFSLVALIAANTVSTVTFDYKIFMLISATLLFIQIFFIAFGVLFSVVIPKVKSAISVSLPSVFTFFVIGMLGSIIGNENVRYITPFKFFNSDYIISHSAYEAKYLIIEAAFVVVTIAASYVIYIKKDVRAAS